MKDRIPHPDTDPVQREKAIQKLKLLNEPMMSLDDNDDYGFDDYGDDYSFGDDDFADDYADGDDFSGSEMSAEQTGDYDSDND